MYILWQYKEGCNNCGINSEYRNGFFTALNMMIAGSLEKTYYIGWNNSYEEGADLEYEAGIRRVQNSYRKGKENWTREHLDGYEKALEIFEEAEDLYSFNPYCSTQ